MLNLGLAWRLGLGLLRSRPTLTILAVGLLALGTALIGGLFGTMYLLRNLQTQFLTALTIEIELTYDTEPARTRVMAMAETWPDVEFVQYVPPETVLREVEAETGEDLSALFDVNPFPACVRVRFGHAELRTLDSLGEAAERMPEVSQVVFPRTLWTDLERLGSRVQGGFGWIAALAVLVAIVLVGFCLRAQVRIHQATWEFLAVMGTSRRTFDLTLFIQEILIGAFGGLLACAGLVLLTSAYTLLLLRPISFPFWFHLTVWLTAILLAIIAGLVSPRRFSFRAPRK
ncbi:permease-like cell division protein FtsX [bacterium]|nr:permease-like cell division protein FtsX [bacterium]MBU1983041.1 permease-like cell division protein FtsX [bacterium]